ncbi:hypothetical protein V7S43_016280 [Phytophthora oleae]|uniref:Crinkler effector protein N-terminal domain-containing protein n=1 Tax=Phytophthora oleae TaxID=2107226 RepID=A0ABD3EZN8_9STRA
MKLVCAFIGVAGTTFEMDIDEVASISTLKGAIKEKNRNKLKDVAAADLQLFLAKRNQKNDTNEVEGEKGDDEEKWLTQDEAQEGVRDTSDYTLLPFPGAKLRAVGLGSGDLIEMSREEKAAGKGPVHVLVVVPKQTFTGKRTRGRDRFPPMAHSMQKFKKILERDAYRVIFADLIRKTKYYFEIESMANLVVTGNSGAGKSRFYLYCIFHILLRHRKEVKELPDFDLVLNFDNNFQLYDIETEEFVRLNKEEVHEL